MITTTWTKTPADLLGLGGSALRECTGLDTRTVIGVSPAPRVARRFLIRRGRDCRIRRRVSPGDALPNGSSTASSRK